MRVYKIEKGHIIDVADVVIVLYTQKSFDELLEKEPIRIREVSEGETQKGRRKWVVKEDENGEYVLSWIIRSGDRSHDGYSSFVEKLKHVPYPILTSLRVTSNGGGCWEEAWIYPVKLYDGDTRPSLKKMVFNEDLADNL